MTAFEFDDVVLVRFPFTDQNAAKHRPAVVISSEAYHRARPDILIKAITSQARSRPAIDEASVVRWKEAGLIKPCKPLLATVECNRGAPASLPSALTSRGDSPGAIGQVNRRSRHPHPSARP